MPRPYHNNFNNKNLDEVVASQRFKYINENDFIKKMRSLKTYCPISYKDLIFNTNKKELCSFPDGRYIKDLYTSDEFRFIYGQIQLVFYVENGKVFIETLSPQQFLLDGYFNLLDIYKGMPYRNDRDKFKIDLMIEMKIGGRIL